MGAFFTYILQVAVLMTVMYLVFKLLLADTTFYRINRFVLLGIYLLSWTLPALLGVDFSASDSAPKAAYLEIGEMSVVPIVSEPQEPGFSWIRMTMWIYLAGVVLAFLISVVEVVRLARLLKGGEIRRRGEVTEIITSEAPGPFSWGRFIVLRPEDTEDNYDMIVSHEMTHFRLSHWLDLIIAQCTLIFQWFSPAAWLMMRTMKVNHEYEVDEIVAGDEPAAYQMMLIKMTVGSRLPVLADSLNHSQLKKRLTMMMTKKSAPSRRLATLALPAVAAVALVALSQPSVARVSEMLSNTTMVPEASGESLSGNKVKDSQAIMQTYVSESRETTKFAVADDETASPTMEPVSVASEGVENVPDEETTAKKADEKPAIFIDGKLFSGDINSIPTDEIATMSVVKNDPAYPQGKIMVVTKGATATSVDNETEGALYIVPEAIADYKGGMAALREFMKEHVETPADLQNPVRVIVQFTIGADGSVSDSKIMRSGGEACDAAALKAVQETSGNWIPGTINGKPVATKFTIPVSFKPAPASDPEKK